MSQFRTRRRGPSRKVYPILSPTEEYKHTEEYYAFPTHTPTEEELDELQSSRGMYMSDEEATEILEELRENGIPIALGPEASQERERVAFFGALELEPGEKESPLLWYLRRHGEATMRNYAVPTQITWYIRHELGKGRHDKTVAKKVASLLGRGSESIAENWVEWVHTLSEKRGLTREDEKRLLAGRSLQHQKHGDIEAQRQAQFRKFVIRQAPSKLKRQILQAIDAERNAEARFFATPD